MVIRDGGTIRFVEAFHLLFLSQLGRRIDRRAFVLKGGCNLRFFHRSIRYSEDIDLDVADLGVELLRERVRETFTSRPFVDILAARGIRLDHVTEHKQTDTTQRWKLGLRVEGLAVPLPTKVEFSRRGLDDGVVFGSVDGTIARAYELPPLMLTHYNATTAFRQKLNALAARNVTQARDVFDLHHLLSATDVADAVAATPRAVVERASANAMGVDFGMFKSQVLAYLPPDDQAHFDSASVWETMVLELAEALGTGDA